MARRKLLCALLALASWSASAASPAHDLVARQTPAPTARPNIPNNAPAGTLSMLQPAATATPSLIKVVSGNPITFSWSLSDVIATPATLTLQAYCSQNAFTYPIGPATGIPGAQTSLVWDPFAYEQQPDAQPLPQASYVLRIFDERGWAVGPTAGYMSPANGPVFMLYHPAAYMPLSEWTCGNCRSAASLLRAVDSIVLISLTTSLALALGSWRILAHIDW